MPQSRRHQLEAQFDPIGSVHLEKRRSRASDGGEPNDLPAAEIEVFLPVVSARMEQLRHLAGLRVAANEVGSFVKIAAVAGEGQVVWGVISSVLPSRDVLNVEKHRCLVVAVQQAVFTPMTGALRYQPAQRGVHQDAPRSASQARALA
jgi:hypothetical protein